MRKYMLNDCLYKYHEEAKCTYYDKLMVSVEEEGRHLGGSVRGFLEAQSRSFLTS